MNHKEEPCLNSMDFIQERIQELEQKVEQKTKELCELHIPMLYSSGIITREEYQYMMRLLHK